MHVKKDVRDAPARNGEPMAAIAVALLTNCCLRMTTAYPARSGAAAMLFTVPLLALIAGCFFLCWRLSVTPFLRVFWAGLLFLSSVREILRISSFLQNAYPGTVLPILCGLFLFLPVIYLRRENVLAQTGHILLWGMIGGGLLLLCSVLPQLRFENLQLFKLTPGRVVPAASAQLVLYPEYLLPALWQGRQNKSATKVAWGLPALGVGADFLIHFLLELFFGAAATERSMPLYTAACSGALSVFTRLEWLQLLLWCGAVGVKLALFFYAVALLLGSDGTEGVSLKMLSFYGGGLLFCCLLFAGHTELTAGVCNAGMWAFVTLTMIGGAAAWLCRKAGRSC